MPAPFGPFVQLSHCEAADHEPPSVAGRRRRRAGDGLRCRGRCSSRPNREPGKRGRPAGGDHAADRPRRHRLRARRGFRGGPGAALRPWTPPATAANAAVWSGFAAGDLITTEAAARSGDLVAGSEYPVAAGVSTSLPVDASPPAGRLPPALSGVGGAVLSRAVLDGARRHRPDRVRRRGEPGAVHRRGPGPDAVPAVNLADLGHQRVR